MGIFETIEREKAQETEKYKPITVDKLLDLEYDVGNLLAFDSNELDHEKILSRKDRNAYLLSVTRDNVQLLVNKIWGLPTERREEAIVARLPAPTYVLPRSRPAPRPRRPTKWEEFARLKGIQKKKKKAKLSWNEQLKRWVPLYGYRRAEARKQADWVIEVPQNADPMEDQFAKKLEAKSERVAKNELQRLRNVARTRNVRVPRAGVLSEMTSSEDLNAAATIAKSSTASLGKFQDKLPKEKEARGVSAITPGASRKRKMAAVGGEQERRENLDVMNAVLNKRPKIDMEKAVNRHINQEQLQRSEEKRQTKPLSKKRGKKGTATNKKPKGGKGQRKGKGSGRKRR